MHALNFEQKAINLAVILFHDFTIDDAIFPASYFIEKPGILSVVQEDLAFLGGIDRSAIADNIFRCRYLYLNSLVSKQTSTEHIRSFSMS